MTGTPEFASLVAVNIIIILVLSFLVMTTRTIGTDPRTWAFGTSTDDNPLILLDSACTGHIAGHTSFLTDITTTFPRIVRGANGISTSVTAGTFALIKVVMQVVPGAPFLLSQALMRDDYKISLIDDSKLYLLRHRGGERTLVFSLYDNVYPLVCVLDADGDVVYRHDKAARHTGGLDRILGLQELAPYTNAFATKSADRSQIRARELPHRADMSIETYTREEVKAACAARAFEKAFLCNGEAVKKLLSGGHLVGCDLAAKDIDRARKIWGAHVDRLMVNPFKSDSIPRVAKEGRTVPRGKLDQVAHVDILYLWGVGVCMFTVRPLCMTIAHLVANKGEAELTKALVTLTDRIKSGGFKIDEIHIDGEKGAAGRECFAKMAERGIRIIPGTRDDHVVIIERENASTRRRLVQLLLGLAFRMPPSWMSHAVTHVLDMKNFVHRSDQKSSEDTAAEMFLGRRFDVKEFYIRFGDYVLCKIPESARTDKGYHREECIFIRRDWLGDDKAVLFSLKTRKILFRKYSELSLLPTPSLAIEVINEIADSEIEKAGMDGDAFNFSKVPNDDERPIEDRLEDFMFEDLRYLYSNRGAARAYAEHDDESIDKSRALPPDARKRCGKAPQSDETFEIEALTGRRGRGKSKQYLVKWTGYPTNSNTWEPASALPPGLIEQFEHSRKGGALNAASTNVEDDENCEIEHPNDICEYEGPFEDDLLRARGERTYIVRMTDKPPRANFDALSVEHDVFIGSVELESPQPMYACAISANVSFDFDETSAPIDERSGSTSYNEKNELRRARRKFASLKAFYATSRTRNEGLVEAFNISMKDAFNSFPSETYESVYLEVKNVLTRTLRPIDSRRLTALQRKRAVACMLFLRIKTHTHTGDFLKLKSRLVACQNKSKQDPSQINHPSSPTVSSTALLTLLAVATSKGYVIASADVPAAYLFARRSKKSETVYAFLDRATTKIALDVQPELQALVDANGRLWGALDYSLYGLVESGYMWYQHVAMTLTSMGFLASDADPCIWIGTFRGEEIILSIYVDDFAAAARTRRILEAFFKELDKTYPGVSDSMSKENIVAYIGCSIDASEEGVTYVNQPEFTKNLVSDFNSGPYGPIKERTSPAPHDLMSIDEESPKLDNKGESYYRSMLMRTAFLVNMTRFDLKVPLMALSRRMHCASEQDMKRLKHLIGYIAKTPNFGLTIKPGAGDLHVFAYTDSAHATTYDLRSVTGGAIMASDDTGSATVYAKCSKQSIVAKSSMECEYIACSDVASQVIHVRNLLISLGIPQPPATIFVDNKSAIHVVKNGRSKAMLTRHIDIRRAWLTDRCEGDVDRDQELRIAYCPTESQVADILTKPLTGALLSRMTSWLLGWEPHPGPKLEKSGKEGANEQAKSSRK